MPDIYQDLRDLINCEDNKEHECRYYLQYIKHVLVKNRAITYNSVETERIGNVGRSDYIISAIIDEGGNESVRAYLWELKAPQCYIFVKDTDNRLKPSVELIDAENKLLHYYYENRDNGLFHRQYSITNSDDVRLGGIIIGSKDRRVRGDYDEDLKNRLYSVAKATRDHLYSNDIVLLTWDDVLAYLQSSETKEKVVITEEEPVIESEWILLTEYYDLEDFPDEPEYDTLEDRFNDTMYEIPVLVKCDCGYIINGSIFYEGVVSSDMSRMGLEQMHVWNDEIYCDKCKDTCSIELEIWEYPQYIIDLVQMPNCTCEVLNKEQISRIVGFKVE
jgi:hypothetical protein